MESVLIGCLYATASFIGRLTARTDHQFSYFVLGHMYLEVHMEDLANLPHAGMFLKTPLSKIVQSTLSNSACPIP